jgi:hypothetical protein
MKEREDRWRHLEIRQLLMLIRLKEGYYKALVRELHREDPSANVRFFVIELVHF